jgi:hypothetical protein
MTKMKEVKNKNKELTFSNQRIGLFSRALFFLFTVLFLGIYNADELQFMAENSYLIFNEQAVDSILNQTAGVLILLGKFLNQSCYIPMLGASLIALGLIAIQYLTEKLFEVNGYKMLITYLVPSMLLIYFTSAGYALYTRLDCDFACVALLGSLFTLGLFGLYRLFANTCWASIILQISVLLSIPFFGIYAILFFAIVIVDSLVKKSPRWSYHLVVLVVALILLLFLGRYLYAEKYLITLLSPSPFDLFTQLRSLLYTTWILIVLMPVLFFYLGKKSGKNIFALRDVVIYSILWVGMLMLVYGFSYKDENFRSEMKLIQLCGEEKWEEMLNVVSEVEQPTKTINVYRIIALARLNKLPQELFNFNFPLKESDGQFLSEEPIYYEDMFFHASLLNTHYLFCSEMYMQVKQTNKRLKYMAIYALMNDEPLLAERFLLQLENSLIYKSWAEKYKKYLNNRELFFKENPTLQSIVNMIPISVDLINVNASAVEQYLMTQQVPMQTIEYRLLSGLYEKKVKIFLKDLKNIRANQLPTCMQEALVIGVLHHKENPSILQRFAVDRNVAIRVDSFFKDLNTFCRNKKKEDAMKIMSKYKGTYCYYYVFY